MKSTLAPLAAHPGYATYLLASLVSWLGMWVQRIGIGWLSWDLTHSAAAVGMVSLALFAPLAAFGPLFGVTVDRVNRRHYAVAVNSVFMVLAALLYAASALGRLDIEVLVIGSLLIGTANAAYQPVRLSLVSDLVSRPYLTGAIALNSMGFNLSRLVGPALGGVAIASLGVASTFLINAVSYVAIIVAQLRVPMNRPAPRAAPQGVFADLAAGLRYACSHALIRRMLLAAAVTSLLARGVLELLPVFADAVFRAGSTGLATLAAASGGGAILSGFVLARAGSGARLGRLTSRTAIVAGLAVATFGLVRSYPVGVAVVAALGFLVTLAGIGQQTLVQVSVEECFRGRVLGLLGVVAIASPALGAAAMGALFQWAGPSAVTVAAGLLCAVLSALLPAQPESPR